MFRCARRLGGLYYFDESPSSHKRAQSLSSISSTSVKETIMLWHRRLKYPSFSYLVFVPKFSLKELIVQFFILEVSLQINH